MTWRLPPSKRIIRILETDEKGDPILRSRLDLSIKKGRLENYVVQLERRKDSLLIKRFKPIVRYNYSHNFFHMDIYDKKGKKFKRELGKFKSFNDAITFAENDIKSNYEQYIKNYEDGLFPNGTRPKKDEKNEKRRKKKKRGRFYR